MSIMDLIEKGKKTISKRQKKQTLPDPLIGAALGLTVGALAGVLLAPKSGKETREDLSNAAKELPGKAKEVLEKAKEKVEETKEKLQDARTKVDEDLEVNE